MKEILPILIIALVLIIAVNLCVYLFILKKPQKKSSKSRNAKENTKRKLQSLYRHLPVVSSLYSKTYNRLSAIYPDDITVIHKRTTSMVSISLLIAIVIMTFGILTSNGNIIYIIGFAFVALVCISLFVDVKLEGLERKVLYSLKNVLPKISKAYDKTKIVTDSIYSVYLSINGDTAYSQKKKKLIMSEDSIMGLHLLKLYNALNAPKSKRAVEMQKFIASSPNIYLTLLLSICSHIQEKGDKGLQSGEKSSFKKQIFELQELVNDEVINTESFYQRMKSLPFLALFMSIPLIKPLEAFCYFCMPELKTSNFFGGAYGTALIAIVLVITYMCYKMIMQIKSPKAEKNPQKTIYHKLLQIKPIRSMVNAYITKHYSKAEKKQKTLKEAGERTPIEQFYVKKVFFGTLGFIISLSLFVSGVVMEKINAIPSYTQSFEETVLPNESYRDLMKQVAEDTAKMTGRKVVDKQTLTEILQEDGRITNTDYIDAVADEIASQNSSYQNIYFKWYFLPICLVIGTIAFYMPEFFLKSNSKLSKQRKKDEINQFRSIISLLMETGGVTTDVILNDMNKFAYYYKEPISKCLISLDRNERKALEELKLSEKGDDEFIDIVDGLLNITHSGVNKSFESIKADKEFYRENRKLEIERENNDKVAKANLCWKVPFYACIIFTLFVPLGFSALEALLQTGIM